MSSRDEPFDRERTLTLKFPQLERSIPTSGKESLFQSARRHGVRIVGACGGRGTCGTCMVHIREGEIAVHTANELVDQMRESAGRKKWVRACRVRARTDCTVEVAPRSLASVVRAEMEVGGSAEILPLDPEVVSRDVHLPEATLQDNLSDIDRVTRALTEPITVLDISAAQRLPQALRDSGWSVRLRLRDHELIDVAAPGSRTLGLAVDLGTTNVAGFLVDLQSGVRLASLGLENPQVAWGADLISRINYAITSPSTAAELRTAAVSAINALAHDLCLSVGTKATEIVDVVVCGNTAMHHLLLGLPVRQLGRAPFVAAVRDGMDIKARELGLNICPGAYVHVAPNVGGFVGGDHVTALLATESHWGPTTTSLVMDIGTNTEISVIHDGVFLSASSPSGPALEGGHISCGMRAAEGAIERVHVEGGRLAVRTIGNKPPVGLCGSGVLDTLATLHRAGIVDSRGRIGLGYPDVGGTAEHRYVVLAPSVHFTQADVRAVQLAKAAIRTATDLLLKEANVPASAIEHFIIAGAFGAYIDIESGIDIGMFPDLPRERFQQVGNAAGAGVRQMVASKQARARARELAAACRYIELSTRTEFQRAFMQNIGFNY